MELKDTNPILHNPILIWYLDLRARSKLLPQVPQYSIDLL
jgi:hypothetical protein